MPDRPNPDTRKEIGLPVREFMYTLDQIAYLLEVTEPHLKRHYIHYEGRSVGVCPKDKLQATNIAPADIKPDWRVPERFLKRWMRFKGWKLYERGYIK